MVGRTKAAREAVSDWLIVVGALLLLISLFLPWSHQFSPGFLAQWGTSVQLQGVPHDPTAWQVYSTADVILALLAVGLVVSAMFASRSVRLCGVAAAAIALGFTLHALSVPPTNGANIFDTSLNVPNYFPNSPGAGVGETVAIIALVLAMGGLALSFTAD